MKVFYDHQIFCEQSFGGISRYFYELIKGSNEWGLFTSIYEVKFSNNIYSQILQPDNNWLTNARFKGKKDLVRMINLLNTKLKTTHTQFDIFHPTYFHQSAIKNKRNKPMFITVFDMIDEKYHRDKQKFSKLIKHRERVIKSANHIITISENTKKDLIEHFNIDPIKVTSIHLASSLNVNNAVNLELDDKANPFILYIGNRSGIHKNFDNYLKSIMIIAEEDRNLQFVFGGGGEFTEAEKKVFQKSGIKERIIYKPIRNDNDLIMLYKQASMLIYPSLYEGFGLPLVEAFSCGLPCATSRGSCLEEIGGNAVAYFDPLDPSDIATVSMKLLQNKFERENLVKIGNERATLFTWKNTVFKTNQLYNDFLT
jgi:glycosyltransferase involved in cell wall biosynthesis